MGAFYKPPSVSWEKEAIRRQREAMRRAQQKPEDFIEGEFWEEPERSLPKPEEEK